MSAKIIVTAIALVSVLAAPAAFAQTSAQPVSSVAATHHARGQASIRQAAIRQDPSATATDSRPLVIDCVHVAFPQCGGN